MQIEQIQKQAKEELEKEQFLKAVEIEKERLRKHRPSWCCLFPFKIIIQRRAKCR